VEASEIRLLGLFRSAQVAFTYVSISACWWFDFATGPGAYEPGATNRDIGLKVVVCRRCVQATLAVPCVCLGQIGLEDRKRCKLLKVKHS